MQNRLRIRGAFAALLLGAASVAVGPVAPATAQPAASAAQADAAIANFYRSRGNAPLWLSPTAGAAAPRLLRLLATAQADGLNPRRYDVNGLNRALRAAQSRDPRAVARAETMLSRAFVAFAIDTRRPTDVGIIYVDPELRPTLPSPARLLAEAAASPSLASYVGEMRWMNPVYGELREALANRNYRSERQRQLLVLNLERARSLPSGPQRYAVVNSAAQRLYMYENGKVVDHMRVVAGKPETATPMMTAFIRFAVLNPYWNAPHDITAARLAPNVLKQGTSYLKQKGYQVMSDWGDDARVVSPASVDWNAVVAGRTPIRLRQLPGPANSMGRMKFMFPNKEGIWLHDTPQMEKLEEAARLASNGCVRLHDAPRFARWLFGRTIRPQGSRPEQQVALPEPVPLYLTYMTAVPSGSSIAYLDDTYGLDSRPVPRRRA